MPYEIQSNCRACGQGDTFMIGNWPKHLGVLVCSTCRALVNVLVETGTCPGCGQMPAMRDFYDYSLAIPYLGGQMPREPEPGPDCPKCRRAPLTFENTCHLNMGMALNQTKARATWGRDYMEKAIFMNSSMPVIDEFQLDPVKVFEYFYLDIPTKPLITRRISFPIVMDIRTHVHTTMLFEPDRFGGQATQPDVAPRSFDVEGRMAPRKRWWQVWK